MPMMVVGLVGFLREPAGRRRYDVLSMQVEAADGDAAMGLAQAIRRKQRVMIRAINRFDVIGFRVGRERSVDDALVESVLREITML